MARRTRSTDAASAADAMAPAASSAATSGAEVLDSDLDEVPEIVEFEPESTIWTGRELWALLGLTALAAAMRLFRLDTWSMWVDEAHSVRDAAMDPGLFWNTNVANYPISPLLLRSLLESLPNLSEGWLRLPYAFVGILTVPIVALLGRSIVGVRASLWGGLLLAVHPWHIFWSQNVRGYAIMVLFATLSVGLFWIAVQRSRWYLYLVSLLLLVVAGLCHPTAYLLAVFFLVVWFLTRWHSPGVYRTGLGVWTLVLVIAALGGAYSVASDQIHWVMAAKSFPSIVHFAQTTGYFMRVPLLVVALTGFLALRRGSTSPETWFLGLWAAIPIATVALLSLGLFQTTAQYVFYCLPAVCLLAGAACVEVTRRLDATGSHSRALRFVVPVVLLVEMLAYDALYFTGQYGDRPRWREAAMFVSDVQAPDKFVLTTNEPSMLFYLHPEQFWGASDENAQTKVRSIETWDVSPIGGEAYLERAQLDARIAGQRLYVVLTEPELAEKDPDGSLRRWLRQRAHELRSFRAWTGPKDMTVTVYEIPTRS